MRLRILHCPNVVGGNPSALCRAQRALGADSHSVTLAANPFGYPVDEDLAAGRGWLRREVARWKMIRRALRDYDVIHYNFGSPLAPLPSRVGGKGWRAPLAALYNFFYAGPFGFWDVREARRRGKIIAVTFQGDDARQGEIARRYPVHFAHEVDRNYYTAESDRHARERVDAFARQADLIYGLNPDLLPLLPARARFQAYCSVDVEQWRPVARPASPPTRLRLVHAPSHRAVKGTGHIEAAVAQLQREGFDLEFILVEKMSHAAAREIYATADLGIDQVLAGFYGALAVELMAFEVPVVCYLREADMGRLPPAMRAELPLIDASPEKLVEVLRTWLGARRGELRALGHRSRAFVQRWHNPQAIAQATLHDYEEAWQRRHGLGGAARE
jgi:hypothetical protein